MLDGNPISRPTLSSTSTTSVPRKEKRGSNAGEKPEKVSTIVRTRSLRPVDNWSCTKSIAQVSFGPRFRSATTFRSLPFSSSSCFSRRLHRHRLRPGRCRGREQAMAPSRRSVASQGAEARRIHGRSRGRRTGLHELPERSPAENPLHQSARTPQWRDQAAHRCCRHLRLVGALLLEQNDEWAVQCGRYMSLETIAALSDDPIVKLPAVAA